MIGDDEPPPAAPCPSPSALASVTPAGGGSLPPDLAAASGWLRLRQLAPWLAVGGLALGVRVWCVPAFAATPLGRYLYLDSRLYERRALAILAGEELVTPHFVEPLYSYVLAVCFWIAGHSLVLVRGLQIAAGTICALLAMSLAQRLANGLPGATLPGGDRARGHLAPGRTALFVGLVVALYGPLVFYDAMILKTSLEVLAFTALAIWVTHIARRATVLPWLAAGAALGIATWLRGNFALLVVPFVFAAWFAALERRLRRVGGVVFGLAVVLSPLLLHNQARGGGLTLTTGAGMNFYQGNRPDTAGSLDLPGHLQSDPEHEEADSIAEASRRVGRTLTPAESSRYWFGEGLRFVTTEPLAWSRLVVAKLVRYWNRFEAADNLSFFYAREVVPAFWLPFFGFSLIGPLGLAGVLTALIGRREERWLAAMVLVWMASVVLFHVVDRYRLASVPVLVVLGGRFAVDLASRFRAAERRPLLARLLLLGAAAVVVNVPRPFPNGQETAPFDRVMGFGLEQEARPDLAAPYNQRAAEGFYRMGREALERRDWVRAEGALRVALDADARVGGVRFHRGVALEQLGRSEEAEAELARAAAEETFGVEALTRLGRLRLGRGDFAGAEVALVAAVERAPERVSALLALGDLRASEQRFAEARALFARAAALEPAAPGLDRRLELLQGRD